MATNQTIDKDALMREYDRESATRIWKGVPKIIVSILIVLFSVYCIWSTLFSVQALEIRLTSFLGMVIIIGYLNYPINPKHVKPNFMPWYDIVLMLLGAAAFF